MWVCVCWERERELYPFPDLPTPKHICQHSKLSVSVFSDLWSDYLVCFVLSCFALGFFADAPPINQDKKVSKENFSIIYLLRTVCELTFSIKQMHYKTGTLWHSDASILFPSANVVLDKRHSDAFILLTSAKVSPASAKVVLDKRPYKISSKAMHRVFCFRWCRQVISWTADVWSELVSLVSCILPPLPWFRAVTYYWPLCLQTRHMWRWLTFIKLRMQSRCSLV